MTVSQLVGDQELFDGTQMTKKTNAWIAPGQLEQQARLGTDTKTPQVAKQLLQTRTPPQTLKNNQQISKSANQQQYADFSLQLSAPKLSRFGPR